MLDTYLHLLNAINIVITTSTVPTFIKNRDDLLLTKEEEKLLIDYSVIFNIFKKANTKLQGIYKFKN